MNRIAAMLFGMIALGGCKTLDAKTIFVKSEWQLKQLQALPIEKAPFPTLKFAEYKVFGSNGCNSYFGDVIGDEEGFELKSIGVTKMACLNDGVMLLEMNFNQMLSRARKVKLQNNELELLDKDGDIIAVFSPLSK